MTYPLREYSAEELDAMPTLCVGQADDLKVEGADDEGQYRVWLSRCSVEDGEPFDNKVSVERFQNGSWSTVTEYPG